MLGGTVSKQHLQASRCGWRPRRAGRQTTVGACLAVVFALTGSSGFAQQDIAPLPATVVARMVRIGVGEPALPHTPNATQTLAHALTTFEAQLVRQSLRRTQSSAPDLTDMYAAGTANDSRTLRQRLLEKIGPPSSSTARVGSSRGAARARTDAAFTKIDAVIRDLETIDGPDTSARAAALGRVRAAAARARMAAQEAPQSYAPPGTVAAPPPSPIELPAADELPAYYGAEREQRAQQMYAFNGDILVLAAAPSTPVEAQSCSFAAADLAADGDDIELTQAIQDQAKALDYSPAAIYEYVANEIAFEPYYGALKGAQNTLTSHAGSATDKASLLIAL